MFEKRICSKGGKATRIDHKKVEERKVKVPSLLVHILEKVKVSIRLVHILEMIFSLQFSTRTSIDLHLFKNDKPFDSHKR